MSDINPINNSLLRYQQPSSAVQPVSTPDSLSALSSLTNSALQLPSTSQLDTLPPAPPEMALHLHNVSAIADVCPETHVDPCLTLSAQAHEARHVMPASHRGEDLSWLGSELPFHAAEEVNDQKRDASLIFLQKVATSIPHVAEQIYLEAIEQQKKTVQAYLRGDSGISDEAAEHAWQYFIVESSEPKCQAFRHIINTSHTVSYADRERLLRSLQRTRISNGAELRENVSRITPEKLILLPDLPANSLSEESIQMLARLGVTKKELQQFSTNATKTAFIREKLLDENWRSAEIKLSDLLREGEVSWEERTTLNNIISGFHNCSLNLRTFIAKDLALSGPNKDNIDISDHFNTPHADKLLYQIFYSYIYSMPRLELYKEIRSHNLSLMDTSLTPPKKSGLSGYRDKQEKLKKLLDNTYEKRSTCMLNNMPALPFLFDIKGERPEAARAVAPYGDKSLPFSFFDNLVNNPDISMQRLVSICLYSTLEMIKITNTGELPLDWMAGLSDATLARIFAPRPYPHEPPFNPKENFICQLRAMQAVKEIGRSLIPDYDHSDLKKLLAWIKPSLPNKISDDDLAYCLFTDKPKYKLYLCAMSTKIINARYPGNNIHYPAADIARDLVGFCLDVTQSEAKHLPSLTASSTRQFNEDIPAGQACSLIAQQLTLRLIQEDREGNFQRWYDSKGNIHTQPPQEVYESFIIRPGELIPLNPDGTQQETIELGHSDNHSLLVGLLNYYRRSPWHERKATQAERDKAVLRVEAEIVDLAKSINASRQTTG